MGQRIGLARTGAGNDQKWPSSRIRYTMLNRPPLFAVEAIEIGGVHGHESILWEA